ncbi:MAG: DUF4417 domain-containing protein [Eggerthellaceae bacterium]
MEDLSFSWGKTPRPGIRDLWNSSLYEGADWTGLDNLEVRCTAARPSENIILWTHAKRLHKERIASGDKDYHVNAFIHCCTDDQNFDGEREGIWKKWEHFYDVASHFDGITGIDFSTNADFPEPLKRYQFHKMRAIEHGAIQRGIPVIPNARWGTPETWEYCFDGIPEGEMLCVGTVGSGLGNIENRPTFDAGLRMLIALKRPPALTVIGSEKYPIFREVRESGIAIFQYDGETCSYFKEKGGRYV